MTNNHPIIPPPELVRQWLASDEGQMYEDWVAIKAARWGANQELEACCAWIPEQTPWDADKLRAARRPKPPSLKEQALEMLKCIPTHDSKGRPNGIDVSIIRRALEQLD